MPYEQPQHHFDGVSISGESVSVVAVYRDGRWRLGGPGRSCAVPKLDPTLDDLVHWIGELFQLTDVRHKNL